MTETSTDTSSPTRPTAHYFALAFVFTWALQGPGALAALRGALPADSPLLPLAMLGIFGPTVAAVVLTARDEGRAGVRRLLAPLLRLRAHPLWYVAALLLPALLLTTGRTSTTPSSPCRPTRCR